MTKFCMLYIYKLSSCVIPMWRVFIMLVKKNPFPFRGQIMLGNLDQFNLMTGFSWQLKRLSKCLHMITDILQRRWELEKLVCCHFLCCWNEMVVFWKQTERGKALQGHNRKLLCNIKVNFRFKRLFTENKVFLFRNLLLLLTLRHQELQKSRVK